MVIFIRLGHDIFVWVEIWAFIWMEVYDIELY